MRVALCAVLWCAILTGCRPSVDAHSVPQPSATDKSARFGDDLAFLRKHTPLVLLSDAAGQAQLIVAPEYQGRVMTSTARGEAGASFGFIHREVVARHARAPHMNVFGGEDRFWLGPEGGPYALYFAPGDPFDLAHWQVPEALDWGAWPVTAQSSSEVRFDKDIALSNYAGQHFALHVERSVRLLARAALEQQLGIQLGEGLAWVGYESDNRIVNSGTESWSKATGLLSIWILGMYNPTPRTTIVLPFRAGDDAALGPIVNDVYFGKVPGDRLRSADGVIYFRGDGSARGKIGIPRPRAKPLVGAYDATGQALTLVQYTLPEDAVDYVNSVWDQQGDAYAGDVVNSYNDGPPAPGERPLGPFYELETSSKAAALAPGEALRHVHRTLHLTGDRAALSGVAQRALGVSLEQIERAFP
jgi:hypothetical protein